MFLSCHTYFSFKWGTLSPENLFEQAKKNKVHKLVLADINNTSAYIDMLRICREYKDEWRLDLAVGIEFRRNNQLLFIGIAKSAEGFYELSSYLSQFNAADKPLLSKAPEFEHVYVVYPWGAVGPGELREWEFIGIRRKEVPRIHHSIYRAYQDRLVALCPVTFGCAEDYGLHKIMRAIGQNTLLTKVNTSDMASPDEIMMPEAELLQYYWQYPRLISNTKRILEECTLELDYQANKNKRTFYSSQAEDHDYLRQKALEGFAGKYSRYDAYVMQRLLHELDVIRKQNFEAYFLITLDIIKYAKYKDYPHVGRGSGANSLVAYCLGITDVDPIELDLYFERFLNPYRSSPPDFDIDFSWKDRDDVVNYVVDKWGHRNAALLGTYTTYQGRSAVRELAKVHGLPRAEIERMLDNQKTAGVHPAITESIFTYAKKLLDFPQNISIHAGGIVLTEEPICRYTATEVPPKGLPVAQIDMFAAESIGIYKYDILSQRGLGHIKDTIDIVKRNKKEDVDLVDFQEFKEDEKIKALLREGRTLGCFYVESPAMRMLLGKLRCEDYRTLVAASSVIRPGVAQSGMMREFIARHLNPDKFDYIHPKMQELMQETYGVMVYQEDVIKVAHHFAGMDLSDADILRRGMSGKYRSKKEFERVEKNFFEGCKKKGYSEEIINEVWRQMKSFSGYSFSKAHSASYAVESYQSLFLKAYYPLEFMVGVINNFGGFYDTEFYFHEARMAGAKLHAPCLNHSEYLTTIDGKDVYMGFIHLKQLQTNLSIQIPEERKQNGLFKGLYNFLERLPVGLEQVLVLIKIGAFGFTGASKQELMWHAYLFFGRKKTPEQTGSLFTSGAKEKEYKLPKLAHLPFEDAYDQIELLGFSLCNPFLLLPKSYQEGTGQKCADSSQLKTYVGKKVAIIGYLVTLKKTYTKRNEVMYFGTFLDHQGDVFDTTHFPDAVLKFPFRGKGFYEITGQVVEDFGYPMIEVASMQKLPIVQKDGTLPKEFVGK